MSNVLFDRETLKVVGLIRPALPFEVEVLNVDPSNLTKIIQVPAVVDKLDENGNPLYLLPQEPAVKEVGITKQIETVQKTDSPVMVTEIQRVPLLDSDNNVVTYPVTVRGETTEVTDEPVMIMVTTEDGTTSEEQKKDDNGNLLYWGQVPTGQVLDCYTSKEVEIQKTDSNGQLLYYTTETDVETQTIENPPLEITVDDERYSDGLEKVTETIQQDKTVSFSGNQSEFNYDDIVSLKQKQIVSNTFYSQAILIEEMDKPNTFSTDLSSFNSNIGFDVVAIPPSGVLRTQKVSLPTSASILRVITESNVDGLEIGVGDLVSSIQDVNDRGERKFDSAVDSVYVQFTNTTDKVIDLKSIAILV